MKNILTHYPIKQDLINNHYSFIDGNAFNISSKLDNEFNRFLEDWQHLEPDNFLKDNKSFRLRRLLFF
ncbi:MAG: hypothetical protein GY810_19270 [Aureispira sp.]|nr:hypothetical protein [Aureispira sp.]